MVEQGAVTRLAYGYFIVTPDDQGDGWKPTIETAAAGIAAAIFGQRNMVLMGVTAARVHLAIPRAIGVAVIAAPRQHRPVKLEDGGKVRFVARDVDGLDARLETLETGQALVTTPEQTLLDLAKRPDLGDLATEAHAAVRNLAGRADWEKLTRLAHRQRARAALEQIEALR
ncbi:type IV toxin-antitoxin system AbiEi family antitoxin [Aeromicrobium sp. A1-2]|uniref:type IV toxin-antitoxin system AbiEi family antitoxin n=1 Tax=Aeromicrobium sp. A1-2 TaxID=2107713 RepID=UPI001C1F7CB7|nr:type IV toxin-antitoxin system AbiEi family antitoxin [Aeromicrobium sp. A1-2]